jgi:predicted methyltransferase
MPTFKSVAIALALAVMPLPATAAIRPAANLAAAVAAPGRTPYNVALDQSRKPAEILRFLGLRRGMNVIDLFGGNKYWSEIIAPAVGPKGKVVVWEPAQFFDSDSKAKFAEFTSRNPNVSIVSTPFEAPSMPKDFADFVMLNLNYHDTYWQNAKYGIPRMEPAAFLKAVYAAMKPGAVIGVIDHVADPNDNTRATVDKLHRIDPNVVKADFRRAGFQLVASSAMLRNRADDHRLLVFDPKIKGHTDRFVFKFKKPR